MTFGKTETINVTFNNKSIAQVAKYKFLGNIIKSVRKLNQNILAENQQYLSNQANRAIGAMYHRLRSVGTLPPHIMLHMFNGLIKPIIVYGSEVWGYNRTAQGETDKVFLRFARQILRVKPTTSNIMIFGECGIMPPSVQCIISTLCYLNRLCHLPEHLIVKQAYDELLRLHDNGFTTWVGNVCELAHMYNLDISLTVSEFKNKCKRVVCETFKHDWYGSFIDINQNPSLRTYIRFKFSFKQEPYLHLIKEQRYRIALSRLRTNSHTLEIECGRHDRPKKPIEARLCSTCSLVEDEQHFVCACLVNREIRAFMYDKISGIYSNFIHLNDEDKFIFLMANTDRRILNWLGKFVYQSFQIRDRISRTVHSW